ncbi:MAG: DUF4345 domain-containing protein [Myxococcales bacterium]|nr:DUF4345 domain-containing protein [Myxococcales bacterium]
MERTALQIFLAILSLIPLAGLVIGFTDGTDFFMPDGVHAPSSLDNQFRYLSGVYVGVTMGLWYTIPAVERRLAAMRLIGAAVMLGGVGRLLSMRSHGVPEDPSMVVGVILELGVVPLLLLWQSRIARQYGHAPW